MEQQKIGAFLKTLRKSRGITQEALAERLGVSNRSVFRWETGVNLPDDQLQPLVTGIRAKLAAAGLEDALGGLKKLF